MEVSRNGMRNEVSTFRNAAPDAGRGEVFEMKGQNDENGFKINLFAILPVCGFRLDFYYQFRIKSICNLLEC